MEKEEREKEFPHMHTHSLTLMVAERNGKFRCPFWDDGYLDESYSCSSCEFHLGGCFACDGKPSGSSFYVCEQCMPNSIFIHKSCSELPQQFQIAFRPHCTFQLNEEYTSFGVYSFLRNMEFHCDFCNQKRKGYRYCCYLCNFQIDVRCAAVLVKYPDEVQQLLEHFTHQHPLVPLKVQDTKCNMCHGNIHGDCYCCASCEFYIHKSCGELLQEVTHPFHPQHSLKLDENNISDQHNLCEGCDLEIDKYKFVYVCGGCNFSLHPECMSLKPSIKYEAHQHLLTLKKNRFLPYCHACGLKIVDTFFVQCVECKLDFHIQCDSESLPPTIVYEDHSHPLVLATEELLNKYGYDGLYCYVCKEETNQDHPFYVCVECEYHAHLRCVLKTVVALDEKDKLKHFSHDHFLFHVEQKTNDNFVCYACKELIQAHPSYGCDVCELYLHKSCAELPRRIQHLLHQHFLTLQKCTLLEFGKCNVCQAYLNDFIYRCTDCGFNLDLYCASQHVSIKNKACRNECKYHEDGENIGHYSHYHDLTVLEERDMECKLCYKDIHGPSYGCASCIFYIHKSCAELPQEVQYSFHQHQSFHLTTSSAIYHCDACGFVINSPGICYRCDNEFCAFNLHPECVSLKPNIKYEGHQHLLILIENIRYQSKCQACLCGIEGTFFVRCTLCQLDFHVQCGLTSLPTIVIHEHHRHPLMLTNEPIVKDNSGLFSCDVCMEERNPIHPFYSCGECEYNAHVRCVVIDIPKDGREKLKHFSHNHFLFLLENQRNDDITCYICKELIRVDISYGCIQCRFYLHKSCAEMPRQMQHLLHRHTLTAMIEDFERNCQCNACQKIPDSGLTYQCGNCNFILDFNCFSLQLRVESEGGEHILSFFENLPHSSTCQNYRFRTHGEFYDGCLKCNFNVHLLHCPLPQVIKIASHQDCLALMNKHDDGNYDTQICDVCEEERNIEEGVYYCEDCDFVAEFNCVISEVLLALRKKPGDVQLITIHRKTAAKGLTFHDMIVALTDEESEQLSDVTKFNLKKEEEEIRMKFSETGHAQRFLYPDEDFLQLMVEEYVISGSDIRMQEDLGSELIDFGDYKMSPSLAGVLKKVLDKYGDIGASCTLSQVVKLILLCYLCGTLRSICNTLFYDVTNELLYIWWWDSMIFLKAGFRVEFVFHHLNRIMKSPQQVDPEFYRLSPIRYHHEEMAKLSRESIKRTEKMDQLRRQQQDVISSIRQETLRSKTEQLSRALDRKRMQAGTGLL